VITEKQLQKQHNIAITKKPVQKAKTLPQKKRKVHKNIAEFPIHKFKRKKDVKLPHHRKEYFQTATRNMSCTIKAKTHGYNMFFIPLVLKVQRLAAVIFEIKRASPNSKLV
jgi:hypothetical protein